MLAMYDEREILLSYIESEKYEAAKEAAEEATKKNAKETAVQMLKDGELSVEQIARYVPALSVEEIIQLQDELLQTV
jgi:hypothetical protein